MNTVHTGVFTCQPKKYDWVTSIGMPKSRCKNDNEYLIDNDSWSVIYEDISLDYDNELDKLILESHTFYVYTDGVCKPTWNHPLTVVCFLEEKCSINHISDIIGRVSSVNNRYWLEIYGSFNTTGKNTERITKTVQPTAFP